MAETEVSPRAATGDGSIGISLYPLPEGDSGAGGDALIEDIVAVAARHPGIVLLIDGPEFFFGKEVEQVDIQFYVLHIRGDGVHLGKQLRRLLHL